MVSSPPCSTERNKTDPKRVTPDESAEHRERLQFLPRVHQEPLPLQLPLKPSLNVHEDSRRVLPPYHRQTLLPPVHHGHPVLQIGTEGGFGRLDEDLSRLEPVRRDLLEDIESPLARSDEGVEARADLVVDLATAGVVRGVHSCETDLVVGP